VLEIESAIMHSTWSKLKMDFPQLIDFSWTTFYQKINELNSLCDKEQVEFAKHILSKQKHQFDEFHSLLLEPTQKLSSSDKELKQELKAGKRILVKEFAKSKNHLSMRQLMDSPAKKWIHLLKPVWLMNPSRISACFPLEQHVFSLTIFDEASQIPLANALGTIQRSKRILIAGDAHQMGPHTFFKTQSEDLVSVLHQASFHWKNVALHHHYRSEHPGLIQFSNQHFYHNQLIAFPTYEQEKQPIQCL
jgi:superfamily I DNA and/or RNA helicase